QHASRDQTNQLRVRAFGLLLPLLLPLRLIIVVIILVLVVIVSAATSRLDRLLGHLRGGLLLRAGFLALLGLGGPRRLRGCDFRGELTPTPGASDIDLRCLLDVINRLPDAGLAFGASDFEGRHDGTPAGGGRRVSERRPVVAKVERTSNWISSQPAFSRSNE